MRITKTVSTPLPENLTAIAALLAWIDKLLDPKKATFQYLSESGSDYCWSKCSDEVEIALIGKMAVNNRAESSFAGVTAQIQDYGRIGLPNGAAISNMGRNGFLDHPLTKTDLKGQRRGLFYSLSQELQLTAVVAAMEYAPTTRKSNNDAQEKQHEAKRRKKELMKDEVSFAVITLAL
jgi:hypothetical protein